MDDNYMFYAFNVNGHTAAIYTTSEEALDELYIRIKESDLDIYGIEPIEGIWHTLERLADFESRSDDEWMENVIYMMGSMIEKKKEDMNLKKNPPKKDKQK